MRTLLEVAHANVPLGFNVSVNLTTGKVINKSKELCDLTENELLLFTSGANNVVINLYEGRQEVYEKRNDTAKMVSHLPIRTLEYFLKV